MPQDGRNGTFPAKPNEENTFTSKYFQYSLVTSQLTSRINKFCSKSRGSFTNLSLSLELNSGAELSQEHQIKNDGCGKERVLAGVVNNERVFPTHEDLRGVLIHGPLTISNIRHVLKNKATMNN